MPSYSKSASRFWTMGDIEYEMGPPLRRGRTAVVHLAVDTGQKRVIAVKVYDDARSSQEYDRELRVMIATEISILQMAQGGVSTMIATDNTTFPTSDA